MVLARIPVLTCRYLSVMLCVTCVILNGLPSESSSRSVRKKEDSVVFNLVCGTALCFLVDVGKRFHGKVCDSTAASAYKVVMQAGICVKVVLSISKGELLCLSQFYKKV